ncbi:MAG: ATP-binding cassette domain-containing protein [Rhodospirillales bacterium]|nr:ATP-binding cassette domain-containing protein [Rhodospirillales bacterium]MDE0378615.1 ATP-binding cassette domain-containing protein [Rhodospirillales bacterium]
MVPLQRRSLAAVAAQTGTPVPCAGNLPQDMGDPRFAWFVDEGAVDLFLVESRDGVEQSAPQHMLRAGRGRLLPGVAPQEGPTTLGLIAKGLPGTVLRRFPAASLAAVDEAEVAAHVDAWIGDVSAALIRDVVHPPRMEIAIEAGEEPAGGSGTIAARRGVVWVTVAKGTGLYLGLIDAAETDAAGGAARGTVPLTTSTWLSLKDAVLPSSRSSEALAREGFLLPALAAFHAVAFDVERLNRSLAGVDRANLERARSNNRRTDEEGARHRLFDLYGLAGATQAGSDDTALREALRIVGRHEGIDFRWPPQTEASDSAALLANVLDASGVRGRRVRLVREQRWWIGNAGAMLAFRAGDGRPVALLPGVLGRYREVDPAGGRTARITARRAEALRTDAWLFYRPLPSGSSGPGDLFRLARRGLGVELARFGIAGLLGGLVMLLPAILLGYVVDQVILSGETSPLYLATAALVAVALIGALLHVYQGMAQARVEGRASSRVEAAFWDRLLRLPAGFLQRYPAGDLAMRGMTFQTLRDAVQGVVANAVLSIVFLLPAFVLIFFYDAVLSGVAAAFGLVSLVVTVALGVRQIAPHGAVVGAARRLAGRLFQLISGISALRVGGAEGSAFAVWARDYREQKLAELRRGAIEGHLQALGAALPLLAGAVLIVAATLAGDGIIAAGDFLVVYTVFLVFQAAVARLGASFGAVAAIMPAFNQVRPLLAEPPETSVDGEMVETLGGDIVFDHVSFRYEPDGPLILDDVSIRARAGEFVAIAGESGAGKSTLFRLALGLDEPSGGAVYYDGRDLRHLNVKQVRRRIGAVPQAVRLHPEDVWDNIVGDDEDATVKDAWHAARLAAVDKEIAAMPMGMMTCVGASAGVTSGGESQRIMIAHALLRNPRILLLDEATNWLDNESQARIMQNLGRLTSTRIVIAHRLSTLRQADRIYVMRAGRVVQEGSFADLLESEGVFRNLVRRQMT